MKKLLFAFLILSVVACKEDTPAPILSEVIQGNYTISIVKIQGLPIGVPFTNPSNGAVISASATVTKKTDTSVTASVTTSSKEVSGKITTSPLDLGEFMLSGDGTKTITVSQNGAAIGTYDVGTKTMNIKANVISPLDNKPTSAEITASKQ